MPLSNLYIPQKIKIPKYVVLHKAYYIFLYNFSSGIMLYLIVYFLITFKWTITRTLLYSFKIIRIWIRHSKISSNYFFVTQYLPSSVYSFAVLVLSCIFWHFTLKDTQVQGIVISIWKHSNTLCVTNGYFLKHCDCQS